MAYIKTEVVLRQRIPLLGGLAIPVDRFGVVLGDAFAVVVHHTEVVLRIHISMLGSLVIPVERFGIVLGDAVAFAVHPPEVDLSKGLPLFRGFSVPLEGLNVVLGDSTKCTGVASVIHANSAFLLLAPRVLGYRVDHNLIEADHKGFNHLVGGAWGST